MNEKTLKFAQEKALTFLATVKDAETELKAEYGTREYTRKYCAATRRASMDLTRALAILRRY